VQRPIAHVGGLVAYDGTDFHGFQRQPHVATVQGVLEDALWTLTQHPVRVLAAGRTDAGVHASGQVVAVHIPWRHAVADLERAWNVHLPAAVVVHSLQKVDEDFHPRYAALDRTYRYTVIEASTLLRQTPKRSPLTDRFALYVRNRLDVAAMNDAAAYLVGEHDFATFGQPPQGDSTVREVYEASWQVVTTSAQPLTNLVGRRLVFTIRANAFLYQMVRNLVGTLLDVGVGRRTPPEVLAALMAKERRRSAAPVAPCGLVLERVSYPQQLGLHFE
jgi:tRNA pseudouridine38-40 synthase